MGEKNMQLIMQVMKPNLPLLPTLGYLVGK